MIIRISFKPFRNQDTSTNGVRQAGRQAHRTQYNERWIAYVERGNKLTASGKTAVRI